MLFFVANVLLQLAVDLGYGSGRESELEGGTKAAMELLRTCGQMFASITTAIAKAAVGIFLLRLAIEPWQRRLIWATLVIFTMISIGKPTAVPTGQLQDHKLTVPVSIFDRWLGWLQTHRSRVG